MTNRKPIVPLRPVVNYTYDHENFLTMVFPMSEPKHV